MMTKEFIRDLIARQLEATIVAAAFEGKSRIQRHQLVYAALGEHMREAIHALSIKTLAPSETQGTDTQNG
jgi:stress-induced morphogen